MDNTFTNPIISGFYPDPSICRVGKDYYMVSSSFEYFPAIPVWHSQDLVSWTQIGHAIDRVEQGLDLSDVRPSGGVQACTIRHHNGLYYITSTSIGKTWPRPDYNFIITATHPAGPWSEVKYFKDAPGIDSSLFFDDDGKAYFMANREKENSDDPGDTEIWIQELDLETLELIGPRHGLWDGCGGVFPEGPHIYKRKGYYYLLIAEGGTGFEHAVTMARSQHIFGPYVPSSRNPILTHRHLGFDHDIQCIGHADIVQTHDDDWYMVCLGMRPLSYNGERKYANLGRETFLVPIQWADDESPIVSPGTGKVENHYLLPMSSKQKKKSLMKGFGIEFVGIRYEAHAQVMDDCLTIKMLPGKLSEDTEVGFFGRRQTHWHFRAETMMSVFLNEDECAGMTMYYNDQSFFSWGLYKANGCIYFKLLRMDHGEEVLLKEMIYDDHKMILGVVGEGLSYTVYVNGKSFYTITDGWRLSSSYAGGHTGAFIGLFASSQGKISENKVTFSEFVYEDCE